MDVLILFASLAFIATIVVILLVRRPGPTPRNARGTEPGNSGRSDDPARDRPAGPAAEAQGVVAPGDVRPAPPDRRARS